MPHPLFMSSLTDFNLNKAKFFVNWYQYQCAKMHPRDQSQKVPPQEQIVSLKKMLKFIEDLDTSKKINDHQLLEIFNKHWLDLDLPPNWGPLYDECLNAYRETIDEEDPFAKPAPQKSAGKITLNLTPRQNSPSLADNAQRDYSLSQRILHYMNQNFSEEYPEAQTPFKIETQGNTDSLIWEPQEDKNPYREVIFSVTEAKESQSYEITLHKVDDWTTNAAFQAIKDKQLVVNKAVVTLGHEFAAIEEKGEIARNIENLFQALKTAEQQDPSLKIEVCFSINQKTVENSIAHFLANKTSSYNTAEDLPECLKFLASKKEVHLQSDGHKVHSPAPPDSTYTSTSIPTKKL